jgi:NAD(P)-dependent dehydrogenase (short-subunit alcohol dehydrogenase family)
MVKSLPPPKDKLAVFVYIFAAWLGAVLVAAYLGYVAHAVIVSVALFYVLKALAHRRKLGPSGYSKWHDAEEVSADIKYTPESKIILVTGPTSGIGEETAKILAYRGARVFLAARSKDKLVASEAKIRQWCAAKGVQNVALDQLVVDFGDLSSVRRAAREFLALGVPLHTLILNAGVMATPPGTTKDGHETQIGINHIGHFEFTRLLLDKLVASAPARVVVLTSSAHSLASAEFFDASNTKLQTVPYHPWVSYGNAKLSNMMFARELNKRYSKSGITAVSVHPGGAYTNLQAHVPLMQMFKWQLVAPFFFKSIPEIASTSVYAATADDVVGGGFHEDNNRSRAYPRVRAIAEDDALAKQLYDYTEALLDQN